MNKQQHVEYYKGGDDAAVQMNGMIAQGWSVIKIIPQVVSTGVNTTHGGGFLVLFERTLQPTQQEIDDFKKEWERKKQAFFKLPYEDDANIKYT